MIRLNLGCGNYPKPGWLNCDRRGGYQRWEEGNAAGRIFELDLTRFPYPFPERAVDLITVSHCLNQVEPAHLPGIVREIYRILKPGGIVRVTDDDTESPESPHYRLPHFHALWITGPQGMGRLLREAGLRTARLSREITLSSDKSILVDNHADLPEQALFFMEGVKPLTGGPPREEGMRRFQGALSRALGYFLQGSIAGWSDRRFFFSDPPLNSETLDRLAKLFEDFTPPLVHWPFERGGLLSAPEFAYQLSFAQQFWEDALPQEKRSSFRNGLMPKGLEYPKWLEQGGSAEEYGPVRELKILLEKRRGLQFFRRGIVHGSVATLDTAPGFSDLDTAFVIRTTVLRDPVQLLELRRLAAEILTLTYAFDPCMHHGPYYLSETDLGWYPEAQFPTVLFGCGLDLVDGAQDIPVRFRSSEDLTDQMFDMFDRFFREWPNKPFALKNGYDVEWVLGNTMILPALYLQRKTGTFRYKRETFPAAKPDFSVEEWEPIEAASALRFSLESRVSPPRRLVQRVLRKRSPGLLQKWVRSQAWNLRRGPETARRLGPDYPRRVGRLLSAMRRKLASVPAPSADSGPVNFSRDEIGEIASTRGFFDDIPYGSFEALPPTKPAAECYEEAAKQIVSQWSVLQDPPVAVYQIGQVRAPGISDLDFVVVLPEGKTLDIHAYRPEAFPESIRALMTHPPYFCTERTWETLPAWYPTFDLRHRWGKELRQPSVPPEFRAGCAFGMLIDYLTIKVPIDILHVAWRRPLEGRLLLAMLHSVKYTVRLAEQSGLEIPEQSGRLLSEMETLRTCWFERDASKEGKKLASLCEEICALVGELIFQADLKISGGSGWSFHEAMEKARNRYAQSGEVIWEGPVSFREVFSIYAAERPRFGKFLRILGASRKAGWDGGVWRGGLRYHAKAMADYGRMAAKLGVPTQKYLALGYGAPSRWRAGFRKLERVARYGARWVTGQAHWRKGASAAREITTGIRQRVVGVVSGAVHLLRNLLWYLIKPLIFPPVAILIGEPFFWIFGFRGGARKAKLSTARKILVIRMDVIGDVVLTTPFLRELRRNCPKAWITLVVRLETADLVKGCPYLDEVLTYSTHGQGRIGQLLLIARAARLARRSLWKRRFDLTLIPRWGQDYYHAAWIAYLSGARRRVAFRQAIPPRSRYGALLTELLDEPDSRHWVEYGLEMLRRLDGSIEKERLELWPTLTDQNFAERILAGSGPAREEPVVAIGPGARFLSKRWPVERFSRLIRKLKSRFRARIVLLGGPSEESLVRGLLPELGPEDLNLVGETTLTEAAAIIARCRLYIGHDSGLTHVAAAVGTPVVQIHWLPARVEDPNSPTFFSPWGERHAILRPEQPRSPCSSGCRAGEPHCILGVTVEQVEKAVAEEIRPIIRSGISCSGVPPT